MSDGQTQDAAVQTAAPPESAAVTRSKGPGIVQLAIVVAILGGAILLTALTSNVSGVSEPGIRLVDGQPFLVEKVGDWEGSPLQGLTEAERKILPADTEGVRRVYTDKDGNEVYCSVILEGSDVTSIHRPELCLTGQGWKFDRERVESIPVKGTPRGVLRMTCIDARRTIKLPQGSPTETRAEFAYWFVGKGRLTPYHWQRILLTTKDRVLLNRNVRWAYFLIYAPMTIEKDGKVQNRTGAETVELIRRFVQDIFPTLTPS
jgi:EpsI family protein